MPLVAATALAVEAAVLSNFASHVRWTWRDRKALRSVPVIVQFGQYALACWIGIAVQFGLTNAVMFGPEGQVLQPSEVLYRRAVLVERGSFQPVNHVNVDMLNCATAQFVQEAGVQGREVMPLMEITVNNLLTTGALDAEDFLSRVDLLGELKEVAGPALATLDEDKRAELDETMERHPERLATPWRPETNTHRLDTGAATSAITRGGGTRPFSRWAARRP